jgi:YfiH family protein
VSRAPQAPATAVALPSLPAPFAWREHAGLVWIDAPLPDARAAFSTRLGGVSEGPYRSLNLGILTDDDAGLVQRNRELLAGALGRDPDAVVMGWQVHGSEVERHDGPTAAGGYARRGGLTKADAQVTAALGLTPLVLTADCVPLALAAPGAVAMVHCGWRGVAAGIVARGVAAVADAAGCAPSAVGAAIGPAIGPCCYEVGAEVRETYEGLGLAEALVDRGLDLPLAAARTLERTGVPARSIANAALCTSCHAPLFFSHRRDGGITGRQAGLAWRTS